LFIDPLVPADALTPADPPDPRAPLVPTDPLTLLCVPIDPVVWAIAGMANAADTIAMAVIPMKRMLLFLLRFTT
jgi:hypothetical protein